jgi:hypothetical protein
MIRAVLRATLGWQFIDKQRACELARHECESKGWDWQEPIFVSEGPTKTRIMTNSQCRGGNAHILLDARTGAILKSEFATR